MFTESDQSVILQNGFRIKDSDSNPNVMEPPITPPNPELFSVACPTSLRSEGGLSDKNDFSDAVLKYISQTLMEEDVEENSCMFNDVLALQAAEKPFYELLCHDYPPSIGYTYSGCDNTNNSSIQSVPVENSFQSSLESDSDLFSSSHPNSRIIVNGQLNSSVSLPAVQNMFSDGVSVVDLNKGVDEASTFLPQSNGFVFNLENCPFASELKKEAVKLVSKTEKDDREFSSNKSSGRKNHHHEDIEVDGRSNKQSAIYVEEDELLEIFDKVHVFSVDTEPLPIKDDETNRLQRNQRSTKSHGPSTHNGKRGSKKEVVALKTLLIQCAKAVAADDWRTANEQLKEIRRQSSAFGNANQRLAHYFANALEVRLSGTGNQLYTAPNTYTAVKTYRNYLEICPFKEISVIFANHMILKVAEKAETLHVIDFGIFYGFQWPILIQSLSRRAGGPPKLRITGIDIPLPGFRPGDKVEETGRRLARYCDRFNVPFEYNAIAQKWETLRIEDLKIGKEEVLVVNCMFRLEKLLDETIVLRSARNAVISLIRKTNPNLFVQAIVNASYSSPYFVTRFKEAVFHFSALFDMQNSIASQDEERFMFEKEFYGQWIMNIVACEGPERVERPEAYKQWVVRNTRAGFIQVAFDKALMKKLKNRMKAYHRHFVITEDGGWVLVGWKGRITSATTCWVPA